MLNVFTCQLYQMHLHEANTYTHHTTLVRFTLQLLIMQYYTRETNQFWLLHEKKQLADTPVTTHFNAKISWDFLSIKLVILPMISDLFEGIPEVIKGLLWHWLVWWCIGLEVQLRHLVEGPSVYATKPANKQIKMCFNLQYYLKGQFWEQMCTLSIHKKDTTNPLLSKKNKIKRTQKHIQY